MIDYDIDHVERLLEKRDKGELTVEEAAALTVYQEELIDQLVGLNKFLEPTIEGVLQSVVAFHKAAVVYQEFVDLYNQIEVDEMYAEEVEVL